MTRYSLTIPFVTSKGRPRRGKNGAMYTPEATRQAEEDIAKLWIAQHGGRLLFEGAVRCTFYVFLPVPKGLKLAEAEAFGPAVRKPDIDNVIKLVDALSGTAFADDKQITTIHAVKRWTTTPPFMVLTLEDDT